MGSGVPGGVERPAEMFDADLRSPLSARELARAGQRGLCLAPELGAFAPPALGPGLAQLHQPLADRLGVLEDLGGRSVLLAQQPEQQVLAADEVVLEAHRLAQGALEQALGRRVEGQLAGRAPVAARADHLACVVERDAAVLERVGGDRVLLAQQAEQHVLGPDVVGAELARLVGGDGDGLAGAVGEALEHQPRASTSRSIHSSTPKRREKRSTVRGASWPRARIGATGVPLTVTSGRSFSIALMVAAATLSGLASPASLGARLAVRSYMPVSAMKPGETALKPTGSSRNSARSERVRPIRPALVAA